ncbi:DNA Replication Regulatory Kinase Subunit [Abortiporus biennis]
MATLVHHHVMAQAIASPVSSMQSSARRQSSAKRARSPEPHADDSQQAKRPKPVDTREETRKEKERKRAEREREFRVKYTRAFPNWVFYFDFDDLNVDNIALRESLTDGVTSLGARVDDFFSKDVTHFITLQSEETFANNKENSKSHPTASTSTALLRSPIKLKGKATKDALPSASEQLIKKALSFDMKVWSAEKLESVLERCYPTKTRPLASASTSRVVVSNPTARAELSNLLEDERLHGTTERDRTQKRHDYLYFSKNSHFVLVEDMKEELATIAALEYPITKGRDGKEKPSYPILYCHPDARGPFVEYDEKERRRKEKAEMADKEREEERMRRKARLREKERRRKTELFARRQGDLRKSASMNNIQRRASMPNMDPRQALEFDMDNGDRDLLPESVNASGYLASGVYMAASGNSVGITSTAGTTSTTGKSLHRPLPAILKERLQQQVVTSRKVSIAGPLGARENTMGPPPVPNRPGRMLRKSRSTNTMRLPKREEGTKPGYCESCRLKFDDFKAHIAGRRHRKFAAEDANFAQLDFLLDRVRRRTKEEVAAMRIAETSAAMKCHEQHVASHGDDVKWEDWVEAEL